MTGEVSSRDSHIGRFCMSVDGLLQLMFIVFSIGFLGLVGFSFLLDYLYQYPMCEICLLQRFIMTMLSVFSAIGAVMVRRIWGIGVISAVAIGLCLGLGLGFAVTHVYMLTAVASGAAKGHACKMVSELTFMPDFWYDFFHSRYQFVPCNIVASKFLGLGFPYWSLIIYGGAGVVFAVVVCVCISMVPLTKQQLSLGRMKLIQWIQTIITIVLVVFFCVWMAASVYFVAMQRKILYRPDRYDQSHQQVLNRVDAIQYSITSGQQCAFAFPRAHLLKPAAKKHLWIVLWGRDATALDAFFNDSAWSAVFNQLSLGASFLLVDYPGFGWNAGVPSERSNRDSVLNAYQAWRKHNQISDQESVNVYLLAHSMGTGVAVDVARSLSDTKGVVLVSPFVSVFQMSKVLLGSWMAWTIRPFLFDRYPTGQRLTQLHESRPHLPVTIFHGDNDSVIPVSHSQNIVHANQWIDYHEKPGYGHGKRHFAGAHIQEVMRKMMAARKRT